MTTEVVPVACTLAPGDFKARAGWIRELAGRSLREVRRDPLTLQLTYAPEAAEQVRMLVRQEQSCCAFLQFDLEEDAAGVRLTITAPERAREAAGLLFSHFAPDAALTTPSSDRSHGNA